MRPYNMLTEHRECKFFLSSRCRCSFHHTETNCDYLVVAVRPNLEENASQKFIICDRLGAACCARGGGIMDGSERSDEDSIEKPEVVERFSCIS